MKRISCLLLCIFMCLAFVGCNAESEPKPAQNNPSETAQPQNTPEKVRDDFFACFARSIGETQNSDAIKQRLEKYALLDMKSDNEGEYYFTCDAGYAKAHESMVILWTDKSGEVQAIGLLGGENRPILQAAVLTLSDESDVEQVQDFVSNFITTDNGAAKAEYEGVTVSKAFNNGRNVITTGNLSSVYTVCRSSALADDAFKKPFEKRVAEFEIDIIN